jgi:hypothetical protein
VQSADCRLPIADFRLPIADCRLGTIANRKSAIENSPSFVIWLIGSLAHWFIGSLAHWLIGSLAHWLIVLRHTTTPSATTASAPSPMNGSALGASARASNVESVTAVGAPLSESAQSEKLFSPVF